MKNIFGKVDVPTAILAGVVATIGTALLLKYVEQQVYAKIGEVQKSLPAAATSALTRLVVG